MTPMGTAVCIVLLTALACSGASVKQRSGVTPVEKVIQLLAKLQQETQEEGTAEAAAYDQFACFCKAQADEKLASIHNAEAKVEHLSASIKKLTGEVTELNEDVDETNKRIDKIEKEMKKEQDIRDAAVKAFTVKRTDAAEAVTGCTEAIEQIQASKTPGTFLLQAKSLAPEGRVARALTKAIADNAVHPSTAQVFAMSSLLDIGMDMEGSNPGTPAGSKFKAGEIIDALTKTLKTFKVEKSDIEMEEAEKRHTFDMAQGARRNSLTAVKDQGDRLDKIIGQKQEMQERQEEEMEKVSNDQQMDEEFLAELTKQCESTASTWDARSKTRMQELKALSEALQILKGGVAENYGANKKLNLLQQESLSFFQLRRHSSETTVGRRVVKYLLQQARRIQSPTLSTLAARMKIDHFKKVRDMIKDLVAKLEADAASEGTQKEWCDDEMEKSTSKRDESIGNVEQDMASITEAKASIKKRTEEIRVLSSEISELSSGLRDAGELRDAEKAENAKTVADSKAGLLAIKAAIKVLKNFYNKNAMLVQTSSSYKPPKSDASGNTVGDLAPKTFDGDYKGQQDASKGIMGLMEVIHSDFEATIEATQNAESSAASEYGTFKTESDADIEEKEGLKKSKQGDVRNDQSDLADFEDNLGAHVEEKNEALEELAKLKPACVATGEDYAEKVKRREQEIESLKTAYKIFEDMDA